MREVILLSHGFQGEYEAGFSNGLAQLGLPVTLIASDATLFDRLDARVRTVNLRGSQDPLRSGPGKLANMMRYWAAYLLYLFRHRGAVVHQIGIPSIGHPLAALIESVLVRCASGGFWLTVHNLLPHDRHTRLNAWIYRRIYRIPYRLVVHTGRMRSELMQRFGVAPDRIVVVEHGVDRLLPDDPAGAQVLRSRAGAADGEGLILFFGNLARYKGLDLLLEALACAGNEGVALVIAGRCKDRELHAELEAAIARHPLRARITWDDAFIPDASIAAYFTAADVLAMPYRHIDQSGVLFMSLSAGVPIVATDVGALRDYITPSVGELVPAGDAPAFASALRRTLAAVTPESRIQRKTAALRWRWQETLRTLVHHYREPTP